MISKNRNMVYKSAARNTPTVAPKPSKKKK